MPGVNELASKEATGLSGSCSPSNSAGFKPEPSAPGLARVLLLVRLEDAPAAKTLLRAEIQQLPYLGFAAPAYRSGN